MNNIGLNENKTKIENVFKDKKALMPFIMAGDPDLETSKEIILALDKNGADLIEIGIPFSDPLADGPVIQASGQRALNTGTNLAKILQMLKSIKEEIQTPYLLMGYLNPILNYGKERFINDTLQAGVSGVIIADLPFDQDRRYLEELNNKGLSPVLMVTPITSQERLELIGRFSKGFIYCVSLLGITGAEQGPIDGIKFYLDEVKKYTDLPLALGFGIDGPAKVKEILPLVDGIIIGSALIKIIEKNLDNNTKLVEMISEYISEIKGVM